MCTEILLLYKTVTLLHREVVIFGQYCSVNLCQIKLHVFRSTEIIVSAARSLTCRDDLDFAIMVNACYFQWTSYSAVWRDWGSWAAYTCTINSTLDAVYCDKILKCAVIHNNIYIMYYNLVYNQVLVQFL